MQVTGKKKALKAKKDKEIEEKIPDNDKDSSLAEDVMPSSKKSTNDETEAVEGQDSPSQMEKRNAMGKSSTKFMKKKERKKAEKAAAVQKQMEDENEFQQELAEAIEEEQNRREDEEEDPLDKDEKKHIEDKVKEQREKLKDKEKLL